MSIDKVRKLTDNKGCQAVMIGTMVLIIAGMVLGPGLGSFGQNPNNPTLFKLNGKDVTANDFEQSMRRTSSCCVRLTRPVSAPLVPRTSS